MVFIPNINDYGINVLVALGNQAIDEFSRNKFRIAIIDKLLLCNSSMFYLINKFMSSQKRLKEAYADVIIMKMVEDDYYLNDILIDDILRYASLDALMYYGSDAVSYDFKKKFVDEFWKRAYDIEDKVELQRKKTSGRRLFKDFCNKRKGDKND